jgi:L-2-hydroxycarboxylate dehydrogenase (NAD+)
MNRPPSEFKRIPADDLRLFAADCLKAAGMLPAHAEELAQLLSNSDLRGVRSHGTRQIAGYCKSLREGRVNPTPTIETIEETETSVLVDGGGGLGYWPMMRATEKAIAKAKKTKVAIGATRHHGHYGSAGHYVRRAMEEG